MKKIILEEQEKTISDEQLRDLYDAACKTEQQIINLNIAAMKTSDIKIKKAAVALKSNSSDFTSLIGLALDGKSDVQDVDTRVNLDQPEGELNLLGENKTLGEICEAYNLDISGVTQFILNEATKKQPKSKVIDMTGVGRLLTEGRAVSEYATFNGKVVDALKEADIKGVEGMKPFILEMERATTPELYEIAMGKLYDFADNNSIEIKY